MVLWLRVRLGRVIFCVTFQDLRVVPDEFVRHGDGGFSEGHFKTTLDHAGDELTVNTEDQSKLTDVPKPGIIDFDSRWIERFFLRLAGFFGDLSWHEDRRMEIQAGTGSGMQARPIAKFLESYSMMRENPSLR